MTLSTTTQARISELLMTLSTTNYADKRILISIANDVKYNHTSNYADKRILISIANDVKYNHTSADKRIINDVKYNHTSADTTNYADKRIINDVKYNELRG
ncbi:MAG: hypothetical protein B6247_29465 [Candidatus Parabeggiatoa sp. nov. 2]|nr:MAG: hypothetical protein B6247_29465 [Beggiatoa sp. 4572_84]